ncbi:MAG: hypothetical protein KQ78_01657 [Candidatus Izimaplasma bacterium HR2]|nr:MAG: hypothetical protein KQ78_01657 [Candidatus Izimaplasma bacterium HR2]
MKEFKGKIFILMELILLFVLLGMIYTVIFVETTIIAFPEYAFQFRTIDISFSLVIVFTIVLLSTGLLIYHQYKKIFNTKALYTLYFVSGYLFLVIQGTLLYGKSHITNSWFRNEFYIDYFGLYKAYINDVSYKFFFDNIVVSIFYSLLFVIVIVSIWKGRLGAKEKY